MQRITFRQVAMAGRPQARHGNAEQQVVWPTWAIDIFLKGIHKVKARLSTGACDNLVLAHS